MLIKNLKGEEKMYSIFFSKIDIVFPLVEERLRKNDYTLSTELTALTISEKIQATTEGLSQQEKEMYKQCQCLLNRQQLIWDKINIYEEKKIETN